LAVRMVIPISFTQPVGQLLIRVARSSVIRAPGYFAVSGGPARPAPLEARRRKRSEVDRGPRQHRDDMGIGAEVVERVVGVRDDLVGGQDVAVAGRVTV